ncbi:chondroadherin-like [Branchiostoma lanceolatum]|uniref:chondroadherin-like n=1 Tax=Branchiostoma lanceolatum TaxID=7740 RepID=UPI00345115CF
MAVKWMVKFYLVLVVRLVVPCVEAGDWQHCQKVGALAKLPQVKTLVIWRSNLQTLRSGTFEGMERLEELLLLGNNITCLKAGAFDGLSLLEYLYLVDNQLLTMAPDMLRGLRLAWLDCNEISSIADGAFDSNKH